MFGDYSGYDVKIYMYSSRGRAKRDISQRNLMYDKRYSLHFVQNTITASGMNFSNNMSIPKMMEVNNKTQGPRHWGSSCSDKYLQPADC